MNKWKIAFWCCLVMLVSTILFSAYILIDQAYNITYRTVGYENLEKDFNQIINIINKTDLSYNEIIVELKKTDLYYFEYSEDNIELVNATLVFKEGRLDSIKNINIIDKYCEHCK